MVFWMVASMVSQQKALCGGTKGAGGQYNVGKVIGAQVGRVANVWRVSHVGLQEDNVICRSG